MIRCALFLAAVLLPAAALDARAAGKADVLVVLGAGAAPSGWANPILVERVCRAALEYKAGRAPAMIVSGGYTTGHIAEAEMMRAAAVAMGVPPAAVILEPSSVNTAENGHYAARIAKRRGFKRAVLVTHRGHMARAHRELESAGGGVWRSIDESEADGAASTGCFRAAEPPKSAYEMLIVDLTEEEPFDAIFERPADVPTPAMIRAVERAAAAYRAGTKRVYFTLPEPSTSTARTGFGSAHGHISRPELARVLATAMGVAYDDIFISSGRRLGQAGGAVEPSDDPWLRIPGARLGLLVPESRRSWWTAHLKRGLNAMLPPPEFLQP